MIQGRKRSRRTVHERAVIFDFDGTIADSLPAIIAVFEDVTHRSEHFTQAQIDALRDVPIPQLMTELHVPKWKIPFLLLRGRKMLRQHLHGIKVHDGMADTIKALHAQNIPLYVLSSNSAENVRSYLQWHKLSHYFAGVYGGASVFGKAPRLLKLIDKEHVHVANTWYIGDETRDVTAARAVGFRAASVTWGFNTRAALEAKHPDVLVDTPEALLKELQQTWKK